MVLEGRHNKACPVLSTGQGAPAPADACVWCGKLGICVRVFPFIPAVAISAAVCVLQLAVRMAIFCVVGGTFGSPRGSTYAADITA
jgi:hypothetical protein